LCVGVRDDPHYGRGETPNAICGEPDGIVMRAAGGPPLRRFVVTGNLSYQGRE